jgi:DNA-binding IclR family transcriptional regulator
MNSLTNFINEGFDRLQQLLLDLQVGDEVRVADVAHATGLTEHTCRSVLIGLERVGLMAQQSDGRFVRCSLDVVGTA